MINRLTLAALGGALLLGACTHDAPVEPDTLVEAPAALQPVTEAYTVRLFGADIGELTATTTGADIQVDYEYRNNGRGPTMAETIILGEDGLPTHWTIDGNTTFGNKVAETFALDNGTASSVDTTDPGSEPATEPRIYIAQNASPYALSVYAQALLADADQTLPAWPAGALRLEALEDVTVDGGPDPIAATAYALTGESLDPTYFLMDGEDELFALVSPRLLIVRKGYEGAEAELTALAVRLASARYEAIQTATAHRFDGPLRIADVRIFDPVKKALTGPVSVRVEGTTIKAIEAANASHPDETVIDGKGGTLIPGLADMHGHVGQDDALLNIAAGVTLIRDMGNDNAKLAELIGKIGD